MSRSQLIPCRGCSRHVRTSDAACPFCGAALSLQARTRPAPEVPRGHLSRAALFAIGAAAAAAAATASVGCSGKTDGEVGDSGVVDAGGKPADAPPDQKITPIPEDAQADVPPIPAYGGPPDAQAAYGGPPPQPDGGIMPMYGAPPP